MLLAWAVILGLIGVNALYVAAEFAAVGVRRSRLRRLAEDGSSLAAQMLPVVEDGRKLDRYVAACQIGITLSSLVLGAYGQATLPPVLQPWLDRAGIEAVGARSASALRGADRPHVAAGRARRAGAEDAGAAVSDPRRRSPP
jgi:putative hemolysin